jgi:hypothetical protein
MYPCQDMAEAQSDHQHLRPGLDIRLPQTGD